MVSIEQVPDGDQHLALPALARAAPRLVANAASIVSSDVLNRASTFVLYALVARFLGAHEFGQLALALTLFYVFQVLAVAGLKTLLIREVARDLDGTGRYLVNGAVIATCSALIAIATLLGFVHVMGYAADTAAAAALVSLGLLPFALCALCEAVFQAWERMHLIVLANLPAQLLKIGLAWLLLNNGAGLPSVLLVLMLSYTLTLAFELAAVRAIARPRLVVERGCIRQMLRSTGPFFGIEIVVAVMSSINVVLLSKLAGETQVGLYSAALQLLVPFTLLAQSLASSAFPQLCRAFEHGQRQLARLASSLTVALVAVLLPITLGLFVAADQLIALLYHNDELRAGAGLFRIAVWSLIPYALSSLLGLAVMAGRRERLSFLVLTTHSSGMVLVAGALIATLGALGAAAALVIDRGLSCLEAYVVATRSLAGIRIAPRLGWPALAGLAMAGCLLLLSSAPLVIALLTAGVVYGGVLAALGIRSLGGPSQVRRLIRQARAGGAVEGPAA